MKSRETKIGIIVVFAPQCRVECPSVAFFILYLCPPGKYSSKTIEKLTFSYTFLYCEKQFRYLILVSMFPIAGACAEFSCHPEIRRVTPLPFLYSVAVRSNSDEEIDATHDKDDNLEEEEFGDPIDWITEDINDGNTVDRALSALVVLCQWQCSAPPPC